MVNVRLADVPLRVALQQLSIEQQTLQDSLAIAELKIIESVLSII